jgi:hypothetical protein
MFSSLITYAPGITILLITYFSIVKSARYGYHYHYRHQIIIYVRWFYPILYGMEAILLLSSQHTDNVWDEVMSEVSLASTAQDNDEPALAELVGCPF